MAREIELGDLPDKRSAKKLVKPKVEKPVKKIDKPLKKTKKVEETKPLKKTKKVEETKPLKKTKKVEETKPAKKEKIKKKGSKSELKKLDDDQLIEEGQAQVERLSSAAFDNNREQVDQYVIMFNKLVRIARKAERVYFKNKQSRDIYALMKVYDQLREVIADMRAMQDISEYVDQLDYDVMQPLAQASAQSIVDMTRAIGQFIKSHLSPEDAHLIENYVKSKAKAAGVSLNDAYRASVNNTRKILAG